MTSFKAAQLACRLEGVTKVLFVVDRKDPWRHSRCSDTMFGNYLVRAA